MIRWLAIAIVYLGAALMVINICGFVRFARYVSRMKSWGGDNRICTFPSRCWSASCWAIWRWASVASRT